jgi:hypothetical protein
MDRAAGSPYNPGPGLGLAARPSRLPWESRALTGETLLVIMGDGPRTPHIVRCRLIWAMLYLAITFKRQPL